MSIGCKASSVVCGLCAILIACDAPSVEPVGPDGTVSGLSIAVDGANLVATSGKASGHAEVEGPPATGIQDERYSFTAMSTGVFPVAKGQVEAHALLFDGREWTLNAELTCMSVEGNRAWVGARITRFIFDGEPQPVDDPIIFTVQDAGEGQNAADRASLLFFPPPGGDVTYCNTRPDRPPVLRESMNGNIQVKPD